MLAKNLYVLVTSVLLLVSTATAGNGVSAEVLAKGSRSWNGNDFSYPAGKPEITITKVTVADGAEVPIHCHPVPLAAYVLKGAIEVTTTVGQRKIFQEGEAFIEVMNVWHKGLGHGETELVVFYAGQEQSPLSVKKVDGVAQGGNCR